MVNMAMKIATRAMDRLGELIEAIPKSKGGRPPEETKAVDCPSSLTRKGAIKDAGLSPAQGKEAVSLARFKADKPEEYEAMLENPEDTSTLRSLPARSGPRLQAIARLPMEVKYSLP